MRERPGLPHETLENTVRTLSSAGTRGKPRPEHSRALPEQPHRARASQGPVAGIQGTVRPDGVVVLTPPLDERSGFRVVAAAG